MTWGEEEEEVVSQVSLLVQSENIYIFNSSLKLLLVPAKINLLCTISLNNVFNFYKII